MKKKLILILLFFTTIIGFSQINSNNKNFYWVQDSVKTYKSATDSWNNKKRKFNIKAFTHNDSISVNKGKMILTNINNDSIFFVSTPINYSLIELIDSTKTRSIHKYYNFINKSWMLSKQVNYDFTKKELFKKESYFKYYDTLNTEISVTRIGNKKILETHYNKYSNGLITKDTLFYSVFNSLGKIEIQVRQGLNQNNKTPVYWKRYFKYNEKGLVIKKIDSNNVNGQLKYSGFEEFSYDNKKRLTYRRILNEYENYLNFKVWYSYDENNNCIKQYYENKDNGYPFVLKKFTYNDNNQIISYTHEKKLKENEKYKTIDSLSFKYDKKFGILIEIKENKKLNYKVDLDTHGNIISRSNQKDYITNLSFNYSIPYEKIKTIFESPNNKNRYKSIEINNNGIVYKVIEKLYSHCLEAITTKRLKKEKWEITKIRQYTYKKIN